MTKIQVSADDVSQTILHRISMGQYHPGDRLPSVRDLAEELGSNRNTVNKAYQNLVGLGVIENRQSGGKGFIVRKAGQENLRSKDQLIDYFHQQSVYLVWKGMAAGISSEEMRNQLSAAVNEVYGQTGVTLVFIECNEEDSNEMGRNLERALDVKVDCAVLGDLAGRVMQMTAEYDLIVTTFHHMSEVLEVVSRSGGSTRKVVGIDTRPTPETMLGIARFSRTHIGLICTMSKTAHMLEHFIYSYHPTWQIEKTLIDEVETVRKVARSCDHLVVTHTCVDDARAMTGRAADVVVNFQIDEQSILFMRQKIQALQREKSRPLRSLAMHHAMP